MDPLLLDVPERFETERLVLRSARAGDGVAVRAAVAATFESLRPWMAWAQQEPTLDAQEAVCRRQQALFILREELTWFPAQSGQAPRGDKDYRIWCARHPPMHHC